MTALRANSKRQMPNAKKILKTPVSCFLYFALGPVSLAFGPLASEIL
jgi:hypothetical protein